MPGAAHMCVGEVVDMVGRLVLARERGRSRLEEDRLGPLAVVRAVVYAPEGLSPWRLRRRLRRAERMLARAGAGRVILDGDFPWRERLTLVRPVDPLPFWRGCADVLALGALAAEGVPPGRGRVALSAPRLCGELERAAERLCPQVRGLLIDAPSGEDYARYLQAKCGLPVTPRPAGAHATVAFGPDGGRWGRRVELYEGGGLGGLALTAQGVELPPDCADQVLALLWERGEVGRDTLRAGRVSPP